MFDSWSVDILHSQGLKLRNFINAFPSDKGVAVSYTLLGGYMRKKTIRRVRYSKPPFIYSKPPFKGLNMDLPGAQGRKNPLESNVAGSSSCLVHVDMEVCTSRGSQLSHGLGGVGALSCWWLYSSSSASHNHDGSTQ